MKNLKTLFSFTFLLTISIACSNKSTKDSAQVENADNLQMITFEEQTTTSIFNSYLDLKDALVATDGEKASMEAKKLEALLDTEKYAPLKEDAQKIAATTDTKIQRESFDSLSEQMIALAKNSGLISGNLFLQHCPMAKGNKGANWLSLSEEIRNPYFGDKMLKCGSIIEKL